METSSEPSPASERGEPTVGHRVARAVLGTSVSQFALIVLGFATSVAQARLLGAAGRGEVMRFANAAALAVLYFGLGINSAITYFVASRGVPSRPLLRSLRPTFAVTVLFVTLCAAVASLTPLRRFLPSQLSGGWTVVALTLFFAASQLGNWYGAVLAAHARFSPINVSSVVIGCAGAIGSALLLWQSPAWAGPAAIIALNTGLEIARSAMLAIAALRPEPEPRQAPQHAAEIAVGFRQVARYSSLTYAGDALQFLTYRFDMWVVDAYHGTAELGQYSLAVSLAQLVWIVPIATARVLFPYAAMMNQADSARLAWRSARIGFAICLVAALLGWAATLLLLESVFGSQFANVPELLGILLLGIVPYSIAKVFGNYLAAINALTANVMGSGTGLLVTIVLDFALIPQMGARGAAIATAISYSFYTVLLFWIFLRKSGLSLRELRWDFKG